MKKKLMQLVSNGNIVYRLQLLPIKKGKKIHSIYFQLAWNLPLCPYNIATRVLHQAEHVVQFSSFYSCSLTFSQLYTFYTYSVTILAFSFVDDI